MHKMETFQKNDSSPGTNTRQSEVKVVKRAAQNLSSPIRTQQHVASFEQNLDLFIQKFQQSRGSQ
jgi:hypothetical protein